jgi:hypothetical protein
MDVTKQVQCQFRDVIHNMLFISVLYLYKVWVDFLEHGKNVKNSDDSL